MVAERRAPNLAPKPKLKVRGVTHSIRRQISGEPLPNLKLLYEELKQLKSQEITKVGVEFFSTKSSKRLEVGDVGERYWRGAGLLLKRLGMTGVYVDDPQACLLQEIFTQGGCSKIAKYLPHNFNLGQLTRATSYYRSQAMERNARRMGLKAIIIGGRHAEHLKDNHEVKYLYDTQGKPQAAPNDALAFQQYKLAIARIIRDMKSGKLKFGDFDSP